MSRAYYEKIFDIKIDDISICFTPRISSEQLAYIRMRENIFYTNYLPFMKKIVGDKIIDIHIYGKYIENADIIINKEYQKEIILKLIDNDENADFFRKQIPDYFHLNHSKVKYLISLYQKLILLPEIIQDNIMLYKGVGLTVYGLRNYNNIDIYFRYLPEMRDEDIKRLIKICLSFRKKIYVTFSQKISGFEGYYDENINRFNSGWANQARLEYFDNIFNKGNYIYFSGLKILKLDINIIYYYRINTVTSYSDVIMARKKINLLMPAKLIREKYMIISNDKFMERDEGKEVTINNKKVYYFSRYVSYFDMLQLISDDIKKRYNIKLRVKNLRKELNTHIKLRLK